MGHRHARARAFLEGALLSLASMVSPRTSGSARGSLAAVLSFVALVSASAVAGDGDPASAFPTATDRGFAAWLARVGGELSEEVVLAHVEGGGRGVFAKDAALENGDEVFSVPADAALVVPSRRAGKAINDLARADPEWALAVLLIRERHLGAASPHAPFLASLFDHPGPPGSVPRRAIAPARPSSPPGPGPDDAAAADRNPAAAAGFARLEDPSPFPPSAVAALEGAHAGRVLAALDAEFERAYDAVDRALIRRLPTAFPRDRYDRRSFRAALAVVRRRRRAFPRAADVRRVGDRTPREVARGGARPGRAPPRARPARRRAVRHRGGSGDGRVRLFRGAPRRGRTMDARGARHGDGGRGEVRCHRGAATPVSLAREFGGEDAGASVSVVGEMTDAEAFARFGTVGAGRNAADAVRVTLEEEEEDDDDEEAEEAAPGDVEAASSDDNSNASSSFARRARAARRGLVASECGDPTRVAFLSDGPSPELLCATRVATANDTEVIALQAKAEATRRGRGGGDAGGSRGGDAGSRGGASGASPVRPGGLLARPVSDAAEARALRALHATAAAILDGYPTSDAEDEEALRANLWVNAEKEEEEEEEEEGENVEGFGGDRGDAESAAFAREAVRCRLREKTLMVNALNAVRRDAESRGVRVEDPGGGKGESGGRKGEGRA